MPRRLFEKGAAADLAAKNPDKAARKLTSLASRASPERTQDGPAVLAAEKALTISKMLPIRFLAARILLEAGAVDKARALAAELASSCLPSRRPTERSSKVRSP